jgi:hypothetical protein
MVIVLTRMAAAGIRSRVAVRASVGCQQAHQQALQAARALAF